jgi:hypothetical protein
MNRVRDYLGFVGWFMGLGYLVLWSLGGPDHRILPPALQGVGLLSATFVCVRLIVLAIARWRVPPATLAAAGERTPAAVLKPPPRAPARPLPTVKPRSQFGLRGRKMPS